MHALHRRRLLVLAGAGTVGLVTAGDLDYARPERERIADEIDEIATTWEHAGPAQTLAALGVLEQRLTTVAAGPPDADWLTLHARTLLMAADAGAAAGRPEEAARAAMHARSAARGAGDQVLEAQATTISAEVYSAVSPRGHAAVEMFGSSARLAGTSPVAVEALTLQANAKAARGDNPTEVLVILRRARQIQAQIPDAVGWPVWTPGKFSAFAGSALVRAGEYRRADEELTAADELTQGQPGIRTAAVLYRAHLAGRLGEWDAAYSYADTAVTAAASRGVPVWLASGVKKLAKASGGWGGDWKALRGRLVEV